MGEFGQRGPVQCRILRVAYTPGEAWDLKARDVPHLLHTFVDASNNGGGSTLSSFEATNVSATEMTSMTAMVATSCVEPNATVRETT